MQKTLRFTGNSGQEYAFTSQPRSDRVTSDRGLFILAYIHPRGHLAGYLLHVLHLGVADNLEESIAQLYEDPHLKKRCWNTTLTLKLKTDGESAAVFQDLKDIPSKQIFAA